MRKDGRKLQLSRETLHNMTLDAATLRDAAGGYPTQSTVPGCSAHCTQVLACSIRINCTQ
jgi:hypothetical protein